MLTIRRVSNTECNSHLSINASCRAISALIIGSAVMFGLTGCGQKGDLYLADSNSSKAAGSEMLSNAGESNNAASASNDKQNARYLEQVLSDVNEDSNDY
ncbi:lipoprotein [Psychrobacter sp. SCQQ22]|uniref:LPS translocon maturation chaperone LptM n=1 Tax=Psychrobacter sp. SCQQ22 TaxID=2792059 RepID=UPI0018CF59FB|nr:lipoprotein [Psychrobacter sp. SCQQ22]MBH0084921.1 lipoprotein [Psychrobacter sp. SCQQ22]